MTPRLTSLSSGIMGRLEQAILNVPALWGKISSVWRYVLVALFVALIGLLSPVCVLGDYRLCLVDLAVGAAFLACLLAGPRYAASALVAICYVYYAKQFVILCDNIVFYAALTTCLVFAITWAIRRLGVDLSTLSTNRQAMLSFVAVLLLPGLVFCVLELSGVKAFLESQSPLAGTYLYHKLALQNILALYLGLIVFFVLGHPLCNLTPRRAFVFVRTLILVIAGFITVLVVFSGQLETERNLMLTRLNNQAANIKSAVERQLSLMMRSASYFEYSTTDCCTGKISVAELQSYCDSVKKESFPWEFAASIFVEPDGTLGNSTLSTARYRLAAVSTTKKNHFGEVWEVGSCLNDSPSFQGVKYVLSNADSPQHELIFNKQFVACCYHSMLIVERGCFRQNDLVGVVVLGLNMGDLVREIANRLDLDDIDLKVAYYDDIDKADSVLVPCYSNTDYASAGILSVPTDASIYCAQPVKVLRFTVAAMPEHGVFLLHSLEDYAIYLACVLIAVFMASGLFDQYCVVDERALEQVRTQESMDQRYEIIAANMCDSLAIVGLDGVLVTANRVGLELLGCTLEEAIGKPLHSLLHHGHPCLETLDCPTCRYFVELRRRLTNGESVADMENQAVYDSMYTSDGQLENYRTFYSHIRNNQGDILIVILGRNVDDLVRVQKVRSDYVATLSHDMRTPLACIKGTLEMFAKFAPKMITENGYSAKGQEMLDLGRRNVTKLNQLINDVLLCDSMENDTLQINQSVQEIAPIVRHVVESLEDSAAKQGLKLVVGVLEGKANVDAIRLDQVLSNLIGNAIKYSRKGEAIFVEAKIYPAEQAIVCRVQDHGIGIPEAKLPTIFDRYEVVNSDSTRMYGGLGLGLTICRGLVKALGGDIWVESVEGEGSTFSFTLPLYVAPGEVADDAN